MTSNNDTSGLRDTRALAQKLWGQCRDSKSAYQNLALDLRKLRNVLEDLEDHINGEEPNESSVTPQLLDQIDQCKAILCGLDLSLQSFRCSSREQQNVQPESVLASKASVQMATHSLLTALNAIQCNRQDSLRSDMRTPSSTPGLRPSTPADTPYEAVATATNVKLSVKNTARIISLGNQSPNERRAFSLDSIREGKRALKPTPFGNGLDPVTSLQHNNWRSPFALPSPLSFDETQACMLLTSRPARFEHTVPRITIGANEDAVLEELEQASDVSPKGQAPADQVPTHTSDETWPTALREHPQPDEHHVRPATPTYVPYRPWYTPSQSPVQSSKSPLRVDSRANISEIQEPQGEGREATNSLKEEPRGSSRDAAGAESEFSHDAAQKLHEVLHEASQPEHAIPPMPSRTPPLPPLPIKRNQFKPPVPPRRRAYRIANPSALREEASSSTTESPMPEPLVVRSRAHTEPSVTTCTSAEAFNVSLSSTPSPPRRASTGALHPSAVAPRDLSPTLGINKSQSVREPEPKTSGTSLEVRFEQDIRRTRSASAPERLNSQSKPTPSWHSPATPLDAPMLVEHPRETGDAHDGVLEPKDSFEAHRESLEASRLENICNSWNKRHWLKAESFLTYHLSNIDARPDHKNARRIRHLLGACASYKGQWHKALKWLISVIRTPVEDTRNLDFGDKAAFYWLGDIYSLLNRKEEALLAYCLAGTCDQLGPASRSLVNHRCLIDEQEQLRNTVPKAAFMNVWTDASFHSGRAAEDTILHSTVVTQAVAHYRLQSFGTKAGPCKLHAVDIQNPQSRNRDANCALDCIMICPNNFESGCSWPMPFDPTFFMANVVRGRLFTHEVDFLEQIQHDADMLQIRKKLPHDVLGTCKCEDLSDLITAFRESLAILAMGWNELTALKSAFFAVRYSALQDSIATTNYFRVEIIRVPIWSEFALSFCTNSTCSARVMHATPKTVKKVNSATEKELKSCLRATLAAVQRQQNRQRAHIASTANEPNLHLRQSVLGKRSRQPSPTPPPPPPKDSTSTAPSIPELRSSPSTPRPSCDTSRPSRDI